MKLDLTAAGREFRSNGPDGFAGNDAFQDVAFALGQTHKAFGRIASCRPTACCTLVLLVAHETYLRNLRSGRYGARQGRDLFASGCTRGRPYDDSIDGRTKAGDLLGR